MEGEVYVRIGDPLIFLEDKFEVRVKSYYSD